jgi:hypothetical protein
MFFNEGNQIHNFTSSSGSGTVISYGSGSGSDFLTSYGSVSGSGSTTLDMVQRLLNDNIFVSLFEKSSILSLNTS